MLRSIGREPAQRIVARPFARAQISRDDRPNAIESVKRQTHARGVLNHQKALQ